MRLSLFAGSDVCEGMGPKSFGAVPNGSMPQSKTPPLEHHLSTSAPGGCFVVVTFMSRRGTSRRRWPLVAASLVRVSSTGSAVSSGVVPNNIKLTSSADVHRA